MGTFIVKNHRFTSDFQKLLTDSIFEKTPITFVAESTLVETPEDAVFEIVIDHIGTFEGRFFCVGYTDTDIVRIEDESGTLYLSTA
jgi:hypothetical protein